MPEMPIVENDLEISIPAVPLREGEEKFAAGLELEDSRRKDSIIEELRLMVKNLAGTTQGAIMQRAMGANEKKRQRDARKKIEELRKLTHQRDGRWYGPCAPATVLNLNPVPLTLMGELQRWSIPAAGKGLSIDLKFRGRTFRASYLTISTPHLYGAHTGTQNDKQSALEMPVIEFNYIPPIGLVHQFYEHFVEGANDAQGMGGVIIFEGDIHTLTNMAKLEKSDQRIWVPKKESLEGYGDVVYIAESLMFEECMEASLMIQRKYAADQINEGHSYSISRADEQRNMLSNYHRTWHNFALDHSYIAKALPWATETLKSTPSTPLVHCPSCHMDQDSPEQYFCKNCNAAFDPLKAFLAGKNVPPADLAQYEGDEWDAIVKEMQRRKAKMAILELPAKPKTKAELKAEADAAEAARAATEEEEEPGGGE